MTWVKLPDEFADEDAMLQAGPLASWLHVAALCYANRHLTDGVIKRAALVQLMCMDGITERGKPVKVTTLAHRLVRVGKWANDGPDYQIVDFFKHQPSRRQVEARRTQIQEGRMRAGAAGGQQTSIKRTASVQPRPVPSRPDPDPLVDPPVVPPVRGDGARSRKPTRRRPINPGATEKYKDLIRR